jgi:DNA-binding transcriptional LysR family regulator
MMLIKHLFFFVTLAQEKHFGRAARSCNVKQPSLTYVIKKLEKELGVQLMDRGHSYVELTAEGEKVLVWAKQMSQSYDQLRKSLQDSKRKGRGQ